MRVLILRVVLIIIVFTILTSCTSISRSIEASGNTSDTDYPFAQANNPALEKPVTVDLSRYKSVHTRPNQRHDLAFAVAASGGGYRAANLTLGVLMGLEEIHSPALKGNLLQEVNYFSSVSGGGFGVGYYLARLYDYSRYHNAQSFSLHRTVSMMLYDTNNPLRMDLSDHLFFGDKRGYDIERKINSSVLATSDGGLTLGDIFIAKNSSMPVQLPYWITNATIYQNAAIFPFTPDVFAKYRVTGYFHNGIVYPLAPNFNAPQYASQVPVAVGVTASATVPFAIPATTLITRGCDQQCYLQLLDGGLSDNLGIYTALTLLLQDKSKIKILIVVDAYQGNSQPYSRQLAPPDNIPLLWRVMTVGTDSNREHVRPNIRYFSRDLMCGSGASNVIVIYLDLSHYPAAQKIGTQFTISPYDQQLLIHIGQDLVRHNKEIKTILSQLEHGQLKLGQC